MEAFWDTREREAREVPGDYMASASPRQMEHPRLDSQKPCPTLYETRSVRDDCRRRCNPRARTSREHGLPGCCPAKGRSAVSPKSVPQPQTVMSNRTRSMSDGKSDRPECNAATPVAVAACHVPSRRCPSQGQRSSQTFALSVVQMTADALSSTGARRSGRRGGCRRLWRGWHRRRHGGTIPPIPRRGRRRRAG